MSIVGLLSVSNPFSCPLALSPALYDLVSRQTFELQGGVVEGVVYTTPKKEGFFERPFHIILQHLLPACKYWAT